MKKIENVKKTNFLKKIFIKFCRIIGFEIIDQSNLYLPTLGRHANENLSTLGRKNISVPFNSIISFSDPSVSFSLQFKKDFLTENSNKEK